MYAQLYNYIDPSIVITHIHIHLYIKVWISSLDGMLLIMHFFLRMHKTLRFPLCNQNNII